MKLAIIGGGGFRVPLVFRALLTMPGHPITEVALHDVDERRLHAIASILRGMRSDVVGMGGDPGTAAAGDVPAPTVSTTTSLVEALTGSDLVFSAMRVGGMEGRVNDEKIALSHGLLGQETTGAGGIAYALRTLPVARSLAAIIAQVCPQAWTINFTNPAGMITQAMQESLPGRVIGICDSPVALARRAVRATLRDPALASSTGFLLPDGTAAQDASLPSVTGHRWYADYLGLNHLGWLLDVWSDGHTSALPALLHRPDLLAYTEEGQLFGPHVLAERQTLPNEYLYYYEHTQRAIDGFAREGRTRGEYLRDQQQRFFDDVRARPDDAYLTWQRARDARDASYLAEARTAEQQRDPLDVLGGGYESVALTVMMALTNTSDVVAELILNVPAGAAAERLPLASLDTVIETVCEVGPGFVRPRSTGRTLGEEQNQLVGRLLMVSELTLRAVAEQDPRLAVDALAAHPLVGDAVRAQQVFADYYRASPELQKIFNHPS